MDLFGALSVTRSQSDLGEVFCPSLGIILLPVCPDPINPVLSVSLVNVSQVSLLLPISTAASLGRASLSPGLPRPPDSVLLLVITAQMFAGPECRHLENPANINIG